MSCLYIFVPDHLVVKLQSWTFTLDFLYQHANNGFHKCFIMKNIDNFLIIHCSGQKISGKSSILGVYYGKQTAADLSNIRHGL